MGAESRAALLKAFEEQFAIPRTQPEFDVVEGIDGSELAQRQYDEILASASEIGRMYEQDLPGREIEETFRREVEAVAKDFLAKAQESNGVYLNALSELQAVLQADAAFATANEERIVPLGNEVGKEHRRFRADLEGIQMTLQALESSDGMKQGTYYQVKVKRALWEFDHNGIRLTVYYIDPISGEKREVQARMDFHYRNSGEYKHKQQAALDLEGAQMTRALELSGRDYHLGELLPAVIKERKEFERLRQGRIGTAKALAQREYSGS